MSEMMPYIWIGVVVFAAIAEIHTFIFIPALFIPAALAAFVMSLTEFHVWRQAAVFFIIALVLFVLSRTVFRKFIKSRRANAHTASIHSFIGKNAIVTQEINNLKNSGTVRINGLTWFAQSEDDGIIYESGLVVTVIRTDGVKAICSR